MIETAIAVEEHASRRQRVLDQLDGALGLVFAGDGGGHIHGDWRAGAAFRWLTGIPREAGAILMFDPTAPNPARRIVLFLKPLDPEFEVWDGFREPLGHELKARLGIETVLRTSHLPFALLDAARRCRKGAALHGLSAHNAPVSPDLEMLQKLAQRVPGFSIQDRSTMIDELRLVKSDAELGLIREACGITAAGFRVLARTMVPGMTEFDAQRKLEGAYFDRGSHRTAYDTIMGGGENGTVLHYKLNTDTLRDGETVCIDSGCEYRGYASDVTRVMPVNGRFTERQREVYTIVLRALDAAIAVAKPGVQMWEVDNAARRVIADAGFPDGYPHGVGHHMGLEVHDPRSHDALAPGMVITIEPGLYLRDEKIGVRLEDDILITEGGNENLTAMIPRTPDEVERAMADR